VTENNTIFTRVQSMTIHKGAHSHKRGDVTKKNDWNKIDRKKMKILVAIVTATPK